MKLRYSIIFIFFILLSSSVAANYAWNGENEAAWNSQRVAASNALDQSDITENEVCEWLEENNQDSFDNNCVEIENSEIDWVSVSRIITSAEEADIEDRWVKISNLITCVDQNEAPVTLDNCSNPSDLVELVDLDNSDSNDENQEDSIGETRELASSENWTAYAVDYDAPVDVNHFIEADANGNEFTFTTGDNGYCGKAYVEKEYTIEDETTELSFSIDANAGDIYNGRLVLWEDDEVIEEYTGEDSFNDEWSYELKEEGTHTIRVGMESEGELGCNQYVSRIDLTISDLDADSEYTGVISEGYYQITNVNSEKEMEVKNGNSEEGKDIQQWEETGEPEDRRVWYVKHPKNNQYPYMFINKETRKVLEVEDGDTANEANIQQGSWNEEEWQQFNIIEEGNNEYKISPIHSDGKAVDIYYAQEDNGTTIFQYNDNGQSSQRWMFNEVLPDAEPVEAISEE